MKITLIQTSPQADKAENLRITRGLMEDAVRTDSPDLIVLPEYFEYYGGTSEEKTCGSRERSRWSCLQNGAGLCP